MLPLLSDDLCALDVWSLENKENRGPVLAPLRGNDIGHGRPNPFTN